jgi:hypothetical protein
LTLNFEINLDPGRKTEVVLKPKFITDKFDFSITGDTRDAGPIFGQLLASVNARNPAFLIHAGDFVKDGEKRKYRAFLAETGVLEVPFYTAIGAHELIDEGEHIYRQLFGSQNYSFTYQNSKFIVFNTSRPTVGKGQLEWLAGELRNGEKKQNIFVITYAASLQSKGFTELMASPGVKAVYSVKAFSKYHPLRGNVRYSLLGHRPGKRYFYRVVHVKGGQISEEEVKIVPRGLTAIDRIVLAFEELKRRVTDYFSR